MIAHALTLLEGGRQHWLWPTRWRVLVGLVVTFALWGWFDVRNRGAIDGNAPWAHKTDFTVYTEAGAAFFDGRDPYAVANPRGWHYLYPPLFAILVAPLSHLDPRNQVLAWFALSVLMGWGCYRELVRIARRLLPHEGPGGTFGPLPTWLGAVACTAAMLPALNCLQRGQVSVAKLYLLLLGFRLLISNRRWIAPLSAGCVWALAIVLKITPAIPVAVVLAEQCVAAWYARNREVWTRAGACWLGTAVGLVAAVVLLPAMFVGWKTNADHLRTWWNTIAVRAESARVDSFAEDSTSPRNQSLVNAAHLLGNWTHHHIAGGPDDQGPRQLRLGGPGLVMDTPLVDKTLFAVRVLAGCLVVAVGFRAAAAGDKLGQAATFGLACAATLILFPIARAHYYVLLLPAVTFVSLWFARQERTGWAVALAVAPPVLVIAHYAWLEVIGRMGLLGVGTTCWLLTASMAIIGFRRSAVSQAALPDGLPATLVAERPMAA